MRVNLWKMPAVTYLAALPGLAEKVDPAGEAAAGATQRRKRPVFARHVR